MTPSNLNLYAWQEMRRRQTLLAAARAMYAAGEAKEAAGNTGSDENGGDTGAAGNGENAGNAGGGENTGNSGDANDVQDTPAEEPKTLKIGDVEYKDFAEAFEAAEDGATIQLTDNTEVPATATVTKSVTIDLGGKNITADDCRAFYVTTGNLTLTGDGTIEINRPEGNSTLADSSSVIRVGSNNGPASLTVGEGVTIKSDYCYGVTYFGQSDISVTVNGKIETTGDQPAMSGNGTSRGTSTVVIGEGAEIKSTKTNAVYNPQPGTTEIYGTVIGYGGVEAKSGRVIVKNGATVTATGTPSHNVTNDGTSTAGYALAAIGSRGGYDNPARITVESGATITGKATVFAESGSTEAGKISSDFDTIEADEGCSWIENGGKYELVRG